MIRRLLGSLAVAVIGAACSSDASESGNQNAAVVGADDIIGDWFICEQNDCSRIDNNANRFQSDGTLVELGTSGDAPVTSDPVCVYVVGEVGTYAFDGTTLTINSAGETLALDVNLRDDRLTLLAVPVSVSHGDPPPPEDVEMIRLPSFEGGCEDPDDGPAASSACMPGMTRTCTCSGRTGGVQACNSTGSGFNVCICDGGSGGAGGLDGGADGSA